MWSTGGGGGGGGGGLGNRVDTDWIPMNRRPSAWPNPKVGHGRRTNRFRGPVLKAVSVCSLPRSGQHTSTADPCVSQMCCQRRRSAPFEATRWRNGSAAQCIRTFQWRTARRAQRGSRRTSRDQDQKRTGEGKGGEQAVCWVTPRGGGGRDVWDSGHAPTACISRGLKSRRLSKYVGRSVNLGCD